MESDADRMLALTQDEQESQMPGATNLEQLRVLEGSLMVGFEFSQLIEKSLAANKQILMWPSTLAAQEAIDPARGVIQILTMGIDQWRPMLVGHVDAII
ncbi:hypothetical protein BSKO_10167 [Bryopsis sp. KO-2023]|nr:hypothetical protein BSKO_10167 [Bryopsis sp. KO-2023]